MKNVFSFVGGTVLGALIGGGVALFFAPKTGKELRQEVKAKYDETSVKLAEQAKEARHQLEAKSADVRTQLEAKTAETRTQIEAKTADARTAFIEKRDVIVERIKTLRAPKQAELNGVVEVVEG
jgi:gas vesicle protein